MANLSHLDICLLYHSNYLNLKLDIHSSLIASYLHGQQKEVCTPCKCTNGLDTLVMSCLASFKLDYLWSHSDNINQLAADIITKRTNLASLVYSIIGWYATVSLRPDHKHINSCDHYAVNSTEWCAASMVKYCLQGYLVVHLLVFNIEEVEYLDAQNTGMALRLFGQYLYSI